MGYKVSLQRKEERKKGYDAVLELSADSGWDPPKILALAKANLKYFEAWDEYPDADFCQQMEWLRTNNYDLYRVFWWWRKSLEDHAKKGDEEDGFQIKETKYRCFMITQFLAKPWSDDWESDRKTLKPGVVPLLTEDKIKEALDRKGIKRWGYILHNEDIYTEEDEIADLNGRIKAGDQKFSHWHIVIDMPSKNTLSAVCRWFGVPPNMVEIIRGKSAFLDAFEYLPHESPKAVMQKKTRYSRDKIEAFGVDVERELNDLQSNRAKYGKRAGEMTPSDTMSIHVLEDGWTLRQCKKADGLTYSKIRSKLIGLRLDYLQDAELPPFRLNIYVDGNSGVGKSSFCKYIAEKMFSGYDRPYFMIGNDERVTFDGYDGEPVIIWDDLRAVTLVKQFKPAGVYKIFDTHPDRISQQVKGSRVVLTNCVNIINGIEPYEQFIDTLAGAYSQLHEIEDPNQSWRRFPMILCVRENDYDILLNKGFMDRDLKSFKTMDLYATVPGSIARLAQVLSGDAKDIVVEKMTESVLTAVEDVKMLESDKITDPTKIPEEFKYYGDVEYAKKLKEQEREEAQKRFLREQEQERKFLAEKAKNDAVKREHLLRLFSFWFWFTDADYAPFEAKYTFAGAIYRDNSLYMSGLWLSNEKRVLYVPEDVTEENINQVLQRQFNYPYEVPDEELRWLASEFSRKIGHDYDPTLLLGYSANELRDSIIAAWLGKGYYTVDDDPLFPGIRVSKLLSFSLSEADYQALREARIFAIDEHRKTIKQVCMPQKEVVNVDSVITQNSKPFDVLGFLAEKNAGRDEEEAFLGIDKES